jgi:hypothetical protein
MSDNGTRDQSEDLTAEDLVGSPPTEEDMRMFTRTVLFIGALAVIGLVGWCIFLSFLLLWPHAIAVSWPAARSFFGGPWTAFVGCAVCFAIAVGLFAIRQRVRVAYALAEVLLGLTGCFAIFLLVPESGWTAALAIASAVYVMVRGIDNFTVGVRELKRADGNGSSAPPEGTQ